MEEQYPEDSLCPGVEPGSMSLPQAGWRDLGPQGPLLLPCPNLPSAAVVPQTVDQGIPGAEAQKGAEEWVDWVGNMLMLLPQMMMKMMMMMAAVVVVVMVKDEVEEEEEEEEERSQPPVCYE